MMSTVEKETIAEKSAKKWLNLIDRAEYRESWLEAAAYFQNNVTRQEWQRTIEGVRQPLGNLLFREVASIQYATTLPGSPDGEYVVIQYNTSFENKELAVETVTPMLERDGEWKAAGYYIK